MKLNIDRRIKVKTASNVLCWGPPINRLVFASNFRIRIYSSISFLENGFIKCGSGFFNEKSLIKWDDHSFLWATGQGYCGGRHPNRVTCYSIYKPFTKLKTFSLSSLLNVSGPGLPYERFRLIRILKLHDDGFCVFCPGWLDFKGDKFFHHSSRSRFRRRILPQIKGTSDWSERCSRIDSKLLVFSYSRNTQICDLSDIVNKIFTWYSELLLSKCHKNCFYLYSGSKNRGTDRIFMIDYLDSVCKKEIRVVDRPNNHDVALETYVDSNQNEIIAYGGLDGIHFYDTETGENTKFYKHENIITTITHITRNMLCAGNDNGDVWFLPVDRIMESGLGKRFKFYPIVRINNPVLGYNDWIVNQNLKQLKRLGVKVKKICKFDIDDESMDLKVIVCCSTNFLWTYTNSATVMFRVSDLLKVKIDHNDITERIGFVKNEFLEDPDFNGMSNNIFFPEGFPNLKNIPKTLFLL